MRLPLSTSVVMVMLLGSVSAEEARAPVKFQDKLPQPTATLDSSGRVLPLPQRPADVDVIGGLSPKPACASGAELPAGEAEALVRRIAAEEQFDSAFAVAVAKAESRLISTALSEKGAYGLMQLTAETAERSRSIVASPPAMSAAACASCASSSHAMEIRSMCWRPTMPASRR